MTTLAEENMSEEHLRTTAAESFSKAISELQHWSMHRIIGEGVYSVVYEAMDQNENLYIFKCCLPFKMDSLRGLCESVPRQIFTLSKLNHKNIVRLMKVHQVPNSNLLFLQLQYLPKNLHRFIQEHKAKDEIIDARTVKTVMRQVLAGLQYLHGRHVMHRDLKPANILIDPASLEVKICDFGLARERMYNDRAYTGNVISRLYKPPELMVSGWTCRYSYAVDMWSFGCVLAEMLLTKPLFSHNEDILPRIISTLGMPPDFLLAKLRRVVSLDIKDFKQEGINLSLEELKALKALFQQKKFPPRDRIENNIIIDIDEQGADLLNRCLDYNPDKRISSREALAHPYFII